MKKQLLLIAIFFFAANVPGKLKAQDNYKHCGTQELHNEYIKTHPEALELERLQNEYTKRYAESLEHLRTPPPVYIIPMVFHILHEYGSENIADDQVLDEMAILNRDYRKLNADTSFVVPSFKSLVADAEIEFRLATIDPNGNCTNGIEHIFTSETNIGDNGSKINQWPRDKYLNVWVVKDIASGAAGYSQYPQDVTGNKSIYDGVMILSTYIGSIGTGSIGTSRALTHEIGHYLNLAHPWGSTNQPGVACGQSDFVTDTPETKGWTVCNLAGSICHPPIIENVQNYMEYAYCSRMFTTGQVTRMRAALTNAPQYPFRANLWSTANLAATGALANPAPLCPPIADFDSRRQYLCSSTNYTFNDASFGGTVASWAWSFPGGTPSSSNLQNPTVQYAVQGEYDVTLTVTNASGSSTVTRSHNIIVTIPWGQANVPYTESFENISVPGNDWYVDDPNGGNSWFRTSNAAKTGTYSMTKNNFAGAPQGTDAFISASMNLMNIYGGSCTFQLAFAIKGVPAPPAVVKDKLMVFSSTDCGKIWSQRYSKTGLPLATGGIVGSSSFVPNASQWALQTIPLSSSQVANHQNVRLKFEYSYDVGNNIYIDDININGTVGIDNTESEQLNMAVTPNPSSIAPVVSFSLSKSQKIFVNVTNVVGQVVDGVDEQMLDAGEHEFQLKADMKPGVYFVQLYLGDTVVSKKIVIE